MSRIASFSSVETIMKRRGEITRVDRKNNSPSQCDKKSFTILTNDSVFASRASLPSSPRCLAAQLLRDPIGGIRIAPVRAILVADVIAAKLPDDVPS